MSDRVKFVERTGPWGFFFLIAYVGAAIYFVAHSNGQFGGIVVALLQAIVWPAYVVYHCLVLLGV